MDRPQRAPAATLRLLQQSRDAEAALRSPEDSSACEVRRDDDSEASSVCSERSLDSYRRHDDLAGEPRRKRRRLDKLIVDRSTQLDSDYCRVRIANDDVELRCATAKEDVIQPRTPAVTLLSRPARSGAKPVSSFKTGYPNYENQAAQTPTPKPLPQPAYQAAYQQPQPSVSQWKSPQQPANNAVSAANNSGALWERQSGSPRRDDEPWRGHGEQTERGEPDHEGSDNGSSRSRTSKCNESDGRRERSPARGRDDNRGFRRDEDTGHRTRSELNPIDFENAIRKKLRDCIAARIDVILGEKIAKTNEELLHLYRTKYPIDCDSALFEAVEKYAVQLKQDEAENKGESSASGTDQSDVTTAEPDELPPPAFVAATGNIPESSASGTDQSDVTTAEPDELPPPAFVAATGNIPESSASGTDQSDVTTAEPDELPPPAFVAATGNIPGTAVPSFQNSAPTPAVEKSNLFPNPFSKIAPPNLNPNLQNIQLTPTPQFQNIAAIRAPQTQNRPQTPQAQNRPQAPQFQNRPQAPQFQTNKTEQNVPPTSTSPILTKKEAIRHKQLLKMEYRADDIADPLLKQALEEETDALVDLIDKRTPAQRQRQTRSSARAADKENIPLEINIQGTHNTEVMPPQSSQEYLNVMLQQAADVVQEPVTPRPPDVEPRTSDAQRARDGRGSETPLGSLDRTEVSLGDSDKTTDSQRFIDEEWGTRGTMLKILRCAFTGVPDITVELLVQRGPVLEGYRRRIAARCFTSILKLSSQGFIKIIKDADTNEIKHIELGPRIPN